MPLPKSQRFSKRSSSQFFFRKQPPGTYLPQQLWLGRSVLCGALAQTCSGESTCLGVGLVGSGEGIWHWPSKKPPGSISRQGV